MSTPSFKILDCSFVGADCENNNHAMTLAINFNIFLCQQFNIIDVKKIAKQIVWT